MIASISIVVTSNEIEDIFHYPLLCYPVQNTTAISTACRNLRVPIKYTIYYSCKATYLDPLSNHRTLYTITLDLLTVLRVQP